MSQPTVFISYSHQNEDDKERLLSHLKVLEREALLETWSDDQITAGADWQQEIDRAIEKARVAILLITADYLSSSFITNEEIPKLLKQRKEKGLKIFPIIVRDCAWDKVSWLSQMQVRPKNKKPVWSDNGKHVDEDLADISREIADIGKDGEISIMMLFNAGLDTETMMEEMQETYQKARNLVDKNPEQTITLCTNALSNLERGPSGDIDDLDARPYTRGKFHLLLASTYLNNKQDLAMAAKHFRESRNQFGSRKWLHLEALAYLGLSIAYKLDGWDEARETISKAKSSVHQDFPDRINEFALFALQAAIKNEQEKILNHFTGLTSNYKKPHEEIILPIINISTGKGLVTTGDASALNLLSRSDYEQNAWKRWEKAVFKKQLYLRWASYILEIDDQVKANDGLQIGDWLIIERKDNLDQLSGKKVAVLLEENNETAVYLRTCVKAEDHYFLKAADKDAVSIVVVNSKMSVARMRDIELLYYGKKIVKRADDIQISGPIIFNESIPKKKIKSRVEAFIWPVPLLNSIVAAGAGRHPVEEVAERYISHRAPDRMKPGYFTVVVEGNSMSKDGINHGDFALIYQDPTVSEGDITAVIIIIISTNEKLGTIKKYNICNEGTKLAHWLLESSNPDSPHLVVMPSVADEIAIQQMYTKKVDNGDVVMKPIFYRNAKISIAGKYVGKC